MWQKIKPWLIALAVLIAAASIQVDLPVGLR